MWTKKFCRLCKCKQKKCHIFIVHQFTEPIFIINSETDSRTALLFVAALFTRRVAGKLFDSEKFKAEWGQSPADAQSFHDVLIFKRIKLANVWMKIFIVCWFKMLSLGFEWSLNESKLFRGLIGDRQGAISSEWKLFWKFSI